jgi:hypothetical protein
MTDVSPDVQTLRDALTWLDEVAERKCVAITDQTQIRYARVLVGELQRLSDAEERIERAWELCTWTSSTKSEIAATLLPGVPFSPPRYDVEERDSGVRQEPDVVEVGERGGAADPALTFTEASGESGSGERTTSGALLTPRSPTSITTAEPSPELDRMTREWALERRAKEDAEARLRDTEHALREIHDHRYSELSLVGYVEAVRAIAKAALAAAAAPPDRPREVTERDHDRVETTGEEAASSTRGESCGSKPVARSVTSSGLGDASGVEEEPPHIARARLRVAGYDDGYYGREKTSPDSRYISAYLVGWRVRNALPGGVVEEDSE